LQIADLAIADWRLLIVIADCGLLIGAVARGKAGAATASNPQSTIRNHPIRNLQSAICNCQ
jgi:hypothetical protein